MEIRAISNHIDNVGIVESSRYASNSNRAETNTVKPTENGRKKAYGRRIDWEDRIRQ